jgi:LysM domain
MHSIEHLFGSADPAARIRPARQEASMSTVTHAPTRSQVRGIGRRPTRPGAPATRLTVRGRIVIVAVVLLAVLGLWAWWGNPTAASNVHHHPVSHSVVVQPGQTLWEIAGRIAPDRDPRRVVADIEDLNGLTDPGGLVSGQSLFVPSYH